MFNKHQDSWICKRLLLTNPLHNAESHGRIRSPVSRLRRNYKNALRWRVSRQLSDGITAENNGRIASFGCDQNVPNNFLFQKLLIVFTFFDKTFLPKKLAVCCVLRNLAPGKSSECERLKVQKKSLCDTSAQAGCFLVYAGSAWFSEKIFLGFTFGKNKISSIKIFI